MDQLVDLAHAITILAQSGDAAALRIAEALAAWRDHAQPIEAALGLPATWRSQYQRQRQHQALSALAGYFPGLSGRELARRMAGAERRYRPAWHRDRKAGHRPDGLNGAVYEVLSLGEFPSETKLRRLFNWLTGPNSPTPVGPDGQIDCAKSRAEDIVNAA